MVTHGYSSVNSNLLQQWNPPLETVQFMVLLTHVADLCIPVAYTICFVLFSEVFPPSILNFENQTAYHQISTELFCNVSAHPMPSQVQWFRGSQPLRNQIEVMDRLLPSACKTRSPGFYRVNGVVGKLIICKPADTLHTGFYTCKAANRKGESNATAFLNVLGK